MVEWNFIKRPNYTGVYKRLIHIGWKWWDGKNYSMNFEIQRRIGKSSGNN
jgi:hypothetical protein